MSDILNLFFSTFWGFFTFLDGIKIFGSFSLLYLIIILFLFYLSLSFLFPHKGD